jgi:tetratricopeptide (TPR) repeat protein
LSGPYNNRGVALQAKGYLQEAIADFNKAIEIDALYARAYANRGSALLLQGKTAEAEKDFERCLKLDASLKPLVEQFRRSSRSGLGAKP